MFSIDDQVAEGDKVVTRWSAHGTHRGDWQGMPAKTKPIPASGRPVTFSATDIYLIRDGKILEEWNTLEQLEVLFQIGAVPHLELERGLGGLSAEARWPAGPHVTPERGSAPRLAAGVSQPGCHEDSPAQSELSVPWRRWLLVRVPLFRHNPHPNLDATCADRC